MKLTTDVKTSKQQKQGTRKAKFAITIVGEVEIGLEHIDDEFFDEFPVAKDIFSWDEEALATFVRYNSEAGGWGNRLPQIGYMLLNEWGVEDGDWDIDISWSED